MKGQFMFSFIVHIVRMKKGLWIFLIFHISRKRWISCGWLKNIGDEYLEQIEGEIWNYILAFQTWETYTSLMAGRRDQRNHTYCRVQQWVNCWITGQTPIAGKQNSYRVFRPDLIYFEDLAGQLKTTFWSKCSYLCIPELWAFVFHQSVFKKVT